MAVQTIAYGQTLSGTLTADFPYGYWTFEGTEGDSVTISMVGVGDMDTYLELYGPDGIVLMADDDSGGNSAALIADYVLPGPGSTASSGGRWGAGPVHPEPDEEVRPGDAGGGCRRPPPPPLRPEAFPMRTKLVCTLGAGLAGPRRSSGGLLQARDGCCPHQLLPWRPGDPRPHHHHRGG